MIDFARITVIGGNGGDGSGSFAHTKGKRRGKADGGDGGRGGHVYLQATGDLNTLEPFRYLKEYKGKDGGSGLSQNRKGAEGEDKTVRVPVGTLISVLGVTGEFDDSNYDLVEHGQKVLLARGGEAGKGNSHLRDEFRRRPFKGEKGKEGEVVNLELELKLIADVGLIGLPNAGKSSLISKLTSAAPKVAAYPFTTLEPNLGVLVKNNKRVVIADIPGLIEGASDGKGLGDLFLRHIERTKKLVHVIDISQGENFWKIYQSVRAELRKYSKELVKKKEIIALNKIDLVDEQVWGAIVDEFKRRKKKVVAISTLSGEGLDNLVEQIAKF